MDRSSQEEVGFEARVRDKIISQIEEKTKNIGTVRNCTDITTLNYLFGSNLVHCYGHWSDWTPDFWETLNDSPTINSKVAVGGSPEVISWFQYIIILCIQGHVWICQGSCKNIINVICLTYDFFCRYCILRWDGAPWGMLYCCERDNKEELWWCYCCKERAKTYLNSPGIPCHTTHKIFSSASSSLFVRLR